MEKLKKHKFVLNRDLEAFFSKAKIMCSPCVVSVARQQGKSLLSALSCKIEIDGEDDKADHES